MKNIKKNKLIYLFIASSLLISFSSQAENYNFSILNRIKIKKQEPSVQYEGNPHNICSIELMNLRKDATDTWHSAISQMSFITNNNSEFNFGNIVKTSRISTTFENGSISASSTYVNGTWYYAQYAISGYEGNVENHTGFGYWLGNRSTDSFRINFNNANIKGMFISEIAFCNTIECRGITGGYYINLVSCNKELVKRIDISERTSTIDRKTQTFGNPIYISF